MKKEDIQVIETLTKEVEDTVEVKVEATIQDGTSTYTYSEFKILTIPLNTADWHEEVKDKLASLMSVK